MIVFGIRVFPAVMKDEDVEVSTVWARVGPESYNCVLLHREDTDPGEVETAAIRPPAKEARRHERQEGPCRGRPALPTALVWCLSPVRHEAGIPEGSVSSVGVWS